MVGRNHSAFTLLKAKQPSLQLIRCVCHSLDIVAKRAMELLPSNIDFMIRETYNWFAHSSKRQCDYRDVYETICDGEAPLKFISPSSTRWLVVSDCIDRILAQEDALKLHFSLVATAEHCYTARLLNEMYGDKSNFLYMNFLKPVLSEIKAVNKNFQLETGDSLGVFRDLERLYHSTLRRVVKPSVLRMNNNRRLLELDLKSSSLYLSPKDADMGTTFQQMMEKKQTAREE